MLPPIQNRTQHLRFLAKRSKSKGFLPGQ